MPFASLTPYRETPIPPPKTARGYRALPIKFDGAENGEPLVRAADYGVAGRNYYAASRNPPYYAAVPGAIDEIVVREGVALTDREKSLFTDEANAMARLADHPYIVDVITAGVTDPDQGARPYLVMRFCPPPDLGARVRAQPMAVPEAISTGIKLASAIETAHRAGIRRVLIPKANLKDLEDVPAEVRAQLEVVGTDEVLANIGEALLNIVVPEHHLLHKVDNDPLHPMRELYASPGDRRAPS